MHNLYFFRMKLEQLIDDNPYNYIAVIASCFSGS